jgi:chromosome segregation ATPase
MRRIGFLGLCLLLLSAAGLGQSTSDESGMQALVNEVRLLRKDLQATNGNALKAQILLYRLQVQEAAVARASQHLNDERARLSQTQDHRRDMAARLKEAQESLDSGVDPSNSDNKKMVENVISRLKADLEALGAEEQQRQTAEMDAEEQLRNEQAKLSALEERVDRLEKELDNPH